MDRGKNPYPGETVPTQPEPIGKVVQAAIAVLFALAAAYLAS